MSPKARDPLERFWPKVNKTSDCWLWTAQVDRDGYGKFQMKRGPVMAHRFAYEQLVGPIPEDSPQLDHRHTCPKNCVRPDHLRPVTQKQNNENQPGAQKHSKSGVRGVWWEPARQRWAAQVRHNGKSIFVGRFIDLEEAEASAIAKRLELFTHNDSDRLYLNTGVSMTVVQLTAQGAPAYPVKVNSEHVASLRPLRKVKPTQNTQTPGATHTVWSGTEILLSSGQKHNVLEDYAEVDNALFGLQEVVTEYPNDPELLPTEEELDVLREPEEWIPNEAELEGIRDDLKSAVAEDFPQPKVEIDRNDGQGFVEQEGQWQEGTTEADEAELQATYGKTSDELADEAEAGYDTSKMTPAEKRKRTLEAKKAAKGLDLGRLGSGGDDA